MDPALESCRSIFNGISDVIVVFDPKTGSVVETNNAVSEMYGYTPEEAKNADIGTLSAGQYPYNYQGGMEQIRHAAGGPPRLFEWLARDRSGRTFWVEVHLKRAAVNGEERILAVVREMAGRRRTEQRLSLQYTVAQVLTEAGTLTRAHDSEIRLRARGVGPWRSMVYGRRYSGPAPGRSLARLPGPSRAVQNRERKHDVFSRLRPAGQGLGRRPSRLDHGPCGSPVLPPDGGGDGRGSSRCVCLSDQERGQNPRRDGFLRP